MLRFRFVDTPGKSYSYSLQRPSDGLRLDFADGTFRAQPGQPMKAVAEEPGIYSGRYSESYSVPAGAPGFWNGVMVLTLHLATTSPATGAASVAVVAEVPVEFQNGSNTQSYPLVLPGLPSAAASFFTY